MEERIEERQKVARAPITWTDNEYRHSEKGSEWYWALGLIAIAAAVASLALENVLFAIFILIAAFVLAIFASREPGEVTFSITQRGVRIDDKLYPYQLLESFSIDDPSPEHETKLVLESKKPLTPNLTVPLGNTDEDEVHDFLKAFLKEEDHAESLMDKIMEWLGF